MVNLKVITGAFLPPEYFFITMITDRVNISWDIVNGTNSYMIYKNYDHYSTFELLAIVSETSYSSAITAAKKFYYVVSSSEVISK